MKTPNFNKNTDGLLPVIVQNSENQQVLMLGYMNEEAYEKTIKEQRVTFFSRSKNRLWTKGETSGNYLTVVSMALDCDDDTLLVQAIPKGPTCHTGTETCFGASTSKGFLYNLEATIKDRLASESEASYTRSLANRGIHKVAQKVGEEATELVIEALRDDPEAFVSEAADLMYHYLLLLQMKGFTLTQVEEELERRSR